MDVNIGSSFKARFDQSQVLVIPPLVFKPKSKSKLDQKLKTNQHLYEYELIKVNYMCRIKFIIVIFIKHG
jgi:hypothetical protein